MEKLYLLLGGNQGDKMAVFSEARTLLNQRIGPITSESAIYETEPWGFESDDLFWNQALEISTHLSPAEVLKQTQQIENGLGRIRKEQQYSSRVIDIDILFYGALILNSPDLTIPHPRIQERRFALVPMCDIAPELSHPVLKKSIRLLLAECTDKLKVEQTPGSGNPIHHS